MIDKYNFEPLKIRAYLASPVLTDGYCPIDGALYYHFIRRKYGVKHRSTPLSSEMKEYGGEQLPILKKQPKSESWFYSASFAQWHQAANYGKTMSTRRFDIEGAMKYVDFGKTTGQVEIKKGPFKNYYFEDITISSFFADWYLMADKKEILWLLPFIHHIGKKASGQVAKWEVSEFHSDWSVRGYEDNRLMRAVPIHKENTPIYGIRPSYWHPKHQVRVVLPKVSFHAQL